ncbi:hypothetical protein P3X46_000713, partial [Hevea brasiliensis]
MTSSDSETENELFTKPKLKINVLSKDQKLLLEILTQVEDSQLQKEFLGKLLKTFEEQPIQKPSILPSVAKNTYDLTAILGRKKTSKQPTVSVQSLQEEIIAVKIELNELKEKQAQDSETIQILLSKQTNEEVEKEDEENTLEIQSLKKPTKEFLFILNEISFRKYLIRISI